MRCARANLIIVRLDWSAVTFSKATTSKGVVLMMQGGALAQVVTMLRWPGFGQALVSCSKAQAKLAVARLSPRSM